MDLSVDQMHKRLILLLGILLIFFSFLAEGKKRKTKLKKIKIKKVVKKVEKAFVPKKKHKRKAQSQSSSSISMISPTATTFTQSFPFISTDAYFTYTDKNFNYFLGYPSGGPNGANFYQNPGLLVAQPTRKCGCCDNKLIIVTRAPDDRDLI